MHKTILGTGTLSNRLQIRPTGENIKKTKNQPLPPCLWSLKNTQVLSALKWRVVFVHVEGSLALFSVL